MTARAARRVLLAAALAATVAVFAAAVGIWHLRQLEDRFSGTRRACECCEESRQ